MRCACETGCCTTRKEKEAYHKPQPPFSSPLALCKLHNPSLVNPTFWKPGIQFEVRTGVQPRLLSTSASQILEGEASSVGPNSLPTTFFRHRCGTSQFLDREGTPFPVPHTTLSGALQRAIFAQPLLIWKASRSWQNQGWMLSTLVPEDPPRQRRPLAMELKTPVAPQGTGHPRKLSNLPSMLS